MATLNNGLQLMNVGSDATQIIKGLVLLAAVAFDVYNKKQGKPSITGLLFRRRPPAFDPDSALVPAGGSGAVGEMGAHSDRTTATDPAPVPEAEQPATPNVGSPDPQQSSRSQLSARKGNEEI